MNQTASQSPVAAALSNRQMITLIILGIALWFVAAMVLRNLAQFGVLGGNGLFLTYALTIPGTMPFIWLSCKLSGLQRSHNVAGISLVTASATICDSIALVWFPAIYSNDPALVIICAAAVFWGAGVALFLSHIISRTVKIEHRS